MRTPTLLLASLAILGSSLLGDASAQTPKHTLKFNHVLGPKEPYHEGFLKWAKRVEERSRGELKIDVFHSAQLGREEDIIEQIRQGANIGQNTDSARMGNYVPGIAVMNGPYFVETLEEVAKLRTSPTVDQVAGRTGEQVRAEGAVVQLGAGLSALLHQQADQDAGGPQGLADSNATRADLAGVDPRARRDAGGDGVRRDVSGPAAEGDRWRRARLQQHTRRTLLRGAEARK